MSGIRNTKRKRHESLGLEGATRSVKCPRWQVTDAGLPLSGLPKLFEILGAQPWTIYRFLRTAHAELGGRTALDAPKIGQVKACWAWPKTTPPLPSPEWRGYRRARTSPAESWS